MMTLHTHITPINITGIAEANAQDQAEADALTLLDAGLDASGQWHEPDRYSTPREDALFIGGCISFIAVMVAAIALVVHYATVIDKVRW